MLKEVRIIGITPLGEQAIKEKIKEGLEEGRVKRAMFKMLGYTQDFIENPFTIIFKINNKVYQKLLNIDYFKSVLKDVMNEAGAIEEEDYLIKWT